MNKVDMLLRAGVAIAFLYPPINALADPNSWIGYFPQFMRGIVDDTLLLHAFGIVEVALALWILSGWKIWLPSFAAAALLLGIVVFNIPQFQVVFRDLSIALAALALALMHLPRQTTSTGS